MKERPLLFKKEMVLATLENRKSQTRRTRSLETINQNPDDYKLKDLLLDKPKKDLVTAAIFVKQSTDEIGCIPCPYGQPSDRLYAREAWQHVPDADNGYYIYAADYSDEDVSRLKPWKPSIHQPKKASRLWMEIKDIRVERLQDISEEDAIAEGIQSAYGKYWLDYQRLKQGEELPVCDSPIDSFRSLWESIHGAGSWETNVWLWVVEFNKVEALCQ